MRFRPVITLIDFMNQTQEDWSVCVWGGGDKKNGRPSETFSVLKNATI